MDPVADQRLVAGVAGTARFYNVDGDGVPAGASGVVTIGVKTLDGTTVVSAGTATVAGTGADVGTYTYGLTTTHTASLGMLVATWSISGAGTFTTHLEVVSRHYLTQADLFELQPSLNSQAISSEQLVRARLAAELEVEWICGRSFVRRARTVTLDGTGDTVLVIPDWDLVTIDAVSVDGTALTVGEIADLYPRTDRAIEQPTGSVWAWGRGNVALTYTYGLNVPPQDLKEALAVRVRELVNGGQSALLARATQFTPDQGGGSYQLDRAGRYKTGNPDVDAVYQRHSKRPTDSGAGGDGAVAGASRSIEMSPQFGSLFHGGRY